MDVSGHAFVIGASGIGRACALAFAKYGCARIVVGDIVVERAQAVISECVVIAANPKFRAEAVAIDIAQEHSVATAADIASRFLGRIDYCVNSAGVGVKMANEIADASVQEFANMLSVNVMGIFLVTRAMSAVMKQQEPVPVRSDMPERGTARGCIVNIGSASGLVATPKMTQYTASKHAVVGVTKNAALDNASFGIRVNSVCPSWVDTPMVRQAVQDVPGLEEAIAAAVPMGRIAVVDEVADAVMFLCSPMASYATGCNLVLDGGTTLGPRLS